MAGSIWRICGEGSSKVFFMTIKEGCGMGTEGKGREKPRQGQQSKGRFCIAFSRPFDPQPSAILVSEPWEKGL